MMLSAEQLVDSQLTDAFATCDTDRDELISQSDLYETEELPAILALVDTMLDQILCPTAASPRAAGGVRTVDDSCIALDGLGLSESEMLRVKDLFDAHAIDGLLDQRRSRSRSALHSALYSLLSATLFQSCCIQ